MAQWGSTEQSEHWPRRMAGTQAVAKLELEVQRQDLCELCKSLDFDGLCCSFSCFACLC